MRLDVVGHCAGNLYFQLSSQVYSCEVGRSRTLQVIYISSCLFTCTAVRLDAVGHCALVQVIYISSCLVTCTAVRLERNADISEKFEIIFLGVA